MRSIRAIDREMQAATVVNRPHNCNPLTCSGMIRIKDIDLKLLFLGSIS